MRRIFIGALLCILVTTIAFAQETNDSLIAIDKAVNGSVALLMLSREGMGRCSGVLLKNNTDEAIILTAKHCIGMDEELYVDSVLAKKVGVSINEDLAYIITDKKIDGKIPIKIAENNPRLNDIVIAVGYPSGELYLKGGLIGIKTIDWQLADLKIISGCSGGGAFNENGELVGIMWGASKESEVAFFEKLEDVKKFIRDNNLL